MASISKDGNGNRTIQFVAGDGRRRSIRLGKLPLKAVREIKTKVESLNGAAVARIGWDKETAEWVGGLESTLYDKLAKVGLVPKRAAPEKATLGPFIDGYIAKRTDVKPNTKLHLERARRDLVGYFGTDKPLADMTEGDADEFRVAIRKRLGENTVRRTCGRARQFFHAAVKRRLIVSNPFSEMKGINVMANKAREYFLSQSDAQRVIEACPDAQWRLLFALSRYGGLRCPSEHLGLRWADVDWERGRLTVHSPKTEHHEGKGERTIPIFPALRPHLEAVWEQAEAGTEYVLTRYRDPNANLRTQFERIIRKAGLTPWPKLFQNLRSTRETELGDMYPIHVVCYWMGNTQAVAAKHYLQVTDAHFDAACSALHNPVQYAADSIRIDSQKKMPHPVSSEECDGMRQFTSVLAPRVGLEPTTQRLTACLGSRLKSLFFPNNTAILAC
ncbi:MAG TPA: tyrosine-type recombinase/integrase [Pirellulales bacterium]|nr:tyrosine-type recombinase/integrase [Pirellulales bacterium]